MAEPINANWKSSGQLDVDTKFDFHTGERARDHLRARYWWRAPPADFVRGPRHVEQPSSSRTAPISTNCTSRRRRRRPRRAPPTPEPTPSPSLEPTPGPSPAPTPEPAKLHAPADAAALSGANRAEPSARPTPEPTPRPSHDPDAGAHAGPDSSTYAHAPTTTPGHPTAAPASPLRRGLATCRRHGPREPSSAPSPAPTPVADASASATRRRRAAPACRATRARRARDAMRRAAAHTALAGPPMGSPDCADPPSAHGLVVVALDVSGLPNLSPEARRPAERD